MRLLVWLLGHMPRRVLLAFGALIASLAGSVLRIRRKHVEESMRRAGIPSPGLEAGRMYRSLGQSLAELLALGDERVSLDGRFLWSPGSEERLHAALSKGRGVVFAASHTGNWDLAACAMATLREMVVVTKHLHVGALDREWQRIRRGRGVTLIDAEGALREGSAAIERGACVAMMIDQVPMSAAHALTVPFLGAIASVDRAPAALAARCGVPLLVTAAYRRDDGKQVLSILDLLTPPERGRSAWVEQATARATEALEAFVRAHPSEWLWMHRRWKEPPSLHPRAARGG